MNKLFLYLFFLFLLIPLDAQVIPMQDKKLPTRVEENLYEPYYQYPSERLKEIKSIPTELVVTKASLEKWDLLIENYLNERPFSPGRTVRVFTYLYAAQADFAFLSQEIYGEIKGSLDPLSLDLIRLFYPFFPVPKSMITDEFSIVLAEMVIEKYQKRLKREEESEQQMSDYFSVQHWGTVKPDFGKSILGWLPWILPPFSLKFTPAPPNINDQSFWSAQLNDVLEANKNVTEEQKKIAEYWGNFFEKGGGNWLQIGNDYLLSHSIDLDKVMFVRGTLSSAIYDTLITAFEAKYTFLIPPPYLRDRNIVPLVDFFYYPSYPSVHTMVSYISALMLGHFFPDKKEDWINLAERIGQSRIWAGVNYPVDVSTAQTVAKILYERMLLEWQ